MSTLKQLPENYAARIRGAWQGRIAGCMLGKAVERFSMREGTEALQDYLQAVQALPLRDFIPYDPDQAPELLLKACCKGQLKASLSDDDVNYSVLALMMLEASGANLATEDVARAWLRHLPLGSTYTAERAAYRTLLSRGREWFPEGGALGFDVRECAQNDYNDWIGAQIRADVYGWVAPNDPALAAQLATVDAQLSHVGEGVYGAVVVAVIGAVVSGGGTLLAGVEAALEAIPNNSDCYKAILFAQSQTALAEGGAVIRERYQHLNVVHTVNNLSLVIWALLRNKDDFSAAIGDVVSEGLDTDCNGATVGALWALQGQPIPSHWLSPWDGVVGVSLAGQAVLNLEDLVTRTLAVEASLGKL
jgi:ADP-ribosylglycohydrolase